MQVLEIFPAARQPRFRFLNVAELPGRDAFGRAFGRVSIHGDILICQAGNIIRVWNFVENIGASFKCWDNDMGGAEDSTVSPLSMRSFKVE